MVHRLSGSAGEGYAQGAHGGELRRLGGAELEGALGGATGLGDSVIVGRGGYVRVCVCV